MKWKRNTGFDQIEDRRGQGGGGGFGGALGGGGGGGIPIPIPGGKAGGGIGGDHHRRSSLFLLFSGVLGGERRHPGPGRPRRRRGRAGRDAQAPERHRPAARLHRRIGPDCSGRRSSAPSGKDYPETKLVLFEGSTQSACGPASSATGPFYCPADQKVYLDLGFFDELQSRASARRAATSRSPTSSPTSSATTSRPSSASAQKVQELAQQDPARQNDLSVRMELQADCLAGVWAHSAASDIEPGDIEEAISAAQAVGDDRIQEATTGRIDPESWTHGSAEQRVQWFTTGYQSGNSDDCDTFGA